MMFAKRMLARRGRRRAAVIGAVLLASATALTACSSGASAASNNNKSSVTGTIRVSAITGDDYIKTAISEFEKKYPGTHVQLTEAPSNTYQPTIRAQLAAKHAPDVMFVWTGSGNAMATQELAKAGLIEDLSKDPWVSSIGSSANALVSYAGKVYSLNTYANPNGVFYNTAMMSKLGVKAPTTFSDLLTWCKNVSSQGTIPIALGNQTGFYNVEIPVEIANNVLYSQDPGFAKKATSSSFKWSTSSEWQSALQTALQQYSQMIKANCFEPNSTGYSDQQAFNLVSTGKALGIDIIANSLPTIISGNPKLKYNMFEIPATKAADTHLTLEPGSAWAVNKNSTNLKAANAFENFLGQPAQLAAAAKADYGLPYTATSSVSVPSDMQGVASLYKAGKTAIVLESYWPNASVKQTMIAQDENLILGKTDVNSAVTAVQKSFAGS